MRTGMAGMCGAVAAAVAIHAGGSWAQTWPGKLVRYVIPFDAGSSPDIVGRTITERLSRLWSQQVVVENRVGAAGTLGSAYVAKSPPDGYTLLQANIASNAIAVSLYAKMPYDQLRDFAPITRIGLTPNIILVHPSVPFRTVRQLVDYAKANPGKLSYSAALVGTSPQLTMELLKLQLNSTSCTFLQDRDTGRTDTIAARAITSRSAAASERAGEPLARACGHDAHVSPCCGVPRCRIRRAQLRGEFWYGPDGARVYAAAILDKINADMHTALRAPEVEKRMLDVAMPPSPRRDRSSISSYSGKSRAGRASSRRRVSLSSESRKLH